jgi:hypothetical protein
MLLATLIRSDIKCYFYISVVIESMYFVFLKNLWKRCCLPRVTDVVQMKSLGQHAAVARLWEIVGPLLRDHGFNAGVGSSTVNLTTKQQQQHQQSPPFSPKSPSRDRRTSTSSAVYLHSPASSQDKVSRECCCM